jgi:hypothetical protein
MKEDMLGRLPVNTEESPRWEGLRQLPWQRWAISGILRDILFQSSTAGRSKILFSAAWDCIATHRSLELTPHSISKPVLRLRACGFTTIVFVLFALSRQKSIFFYPNRYKITPARIRAISKAS